MTVTELMIETTGEPDTLATPAEQSPPAPVPTPPAPVPTASGSGSAGELSTAVDALEQRVAALDARLSELANQRRDDADLVESGHSRLAAVEAAHTSAATSVDAVTGRLDSAERRLKSSDAATRAARGEIDALTERLASVDGRLGAVDDTLLALRQQQADHDRALADITRSIAAEVERQSSDALVESQHNLQLAVNSIAQLALAMAESARDITADVSPESATALLDSFRTDLDAILGQLGFEPLRATVGTTFDARRHRALKRVETSDPAQDKTITRVIRDGYRSASTGRILLFADVEVSRHRP